MMQLTLDFSNWIKLPTVIAYIVNRAHQVHYTSGKPDIQRESRIRPGAYAINPFDHRSKIPLAVYQQFPPAGTVYDIACRQLLIFFRRCFNPELVSAELAEEQDMFVP